MIRQFMVEKGILDGMHAKPEIFLKNSPSFNTLLTFKYTLLRNLPLSKSRMDTQENTATTNIRVCAWFMCKLLAYTIYETC